jgi:predicted nucleic acid-binding Zn ribbon protein
MKCELCQEHTNKVFHKQMWSMKVDCCEKCYNYLTFGVKKQVDWLITFWLIFLLLLHLDYMVNK